jgi:hypothetical protein
MPYLQTSATHELSLVAGAVVSGSSPLVGSPTIGLDESRMVLLGGAYVATGAALNMLWLVTREE